MSYYTVRMRLISTLQDSDHDKCDLYFRTLQHFHLKFKECKRGINYSLNNNVNPESTVIRVMMNRG